MSAVTRIQAIVVAFRPEPERLSQALASLRAQVDSVLVVDNGGQGQSLRELVNQSVAGLGRVIEQPGNSGVAAALNRGICEGERGAPSYYLFMDDDSVPAPDMVSRLRDALERAASRGERIAAAGPLCIDDRSAAAASFVRVGWLRFQRIACGESTDAVVRSDLLINSGMLIPAPVLREIGAMDESLFIDHVDTEWCLRARSHGYGLLGVCGARLSHRLGDDSIPVTPSRRIHRHSGFRYRYIFRNSVLLYGRNYPGLKWKIADGLRLVALFGAIAIFVAPRRKNLWAAVLGLADGLRGRCGPASGSQ